MSEVIVRMEMPSECEYCPMCRYYRENGRVWCNAANRILKPVWDCPDWTHLNVARPSWCPISGVLPEQHGRLIDASTVLFAAEDSEGVVPPMPVTVEDYLESFDLPTIVPATERSET